MSEKIRKNYALSKTTLEHIHWLQEVVGLTTETAVIETAIAEMRLKYSVLATDDNQAAPASSPRH